MKKKELARLEAELEAIDLWNALLLSRGNELDETEKVGFKTSNE